MFMFVLNIRLHFGVLARKYSALVTLYVPATAVMNVAAV
jgi:hypothetical protein